jgi:hypothetical protein
LVAVAAGFFFVRTALDLLRGVFEAFVVGFATGHYCQAWAVTVKGTHEDP